MRSGMKDRTVGRQGGTRLVLAGVAFALLATVVPLATASASVQRSDGAYASTQITCSASMQWVKTTLYVKQATGLSSQSAAFRQYIYDIDAKAGFWTSWTGLKAPFYGTFTRATLGYSRFQVYMEYSWYRNGAWRTAGEWITKYGQAYAGSGGSMTMSYCQV
jgi:hypothetical protein